MADPRSNCQNKCAIGYCNAVIVSRDF
jgi:hypothetical protein